jgi:Protein of unknown function (DUF3298)
MRIFLSYAHEDRAIIEDCYQKLAAHGNTYFTCFNFLLAPTYNLEIHHFFQYYRPSSSPRFNDEFLGFVSGKLRESILRQAWERGIGELDKEWLARGTAPKEVPNIPFTFSSSGLTFYLAPYSVAYYAAGSWEVMVPFYDLRAILNPEGPHKFALR